MRVPLSFYPVACGAALSSPLAEQLAFRSCVQGCSAGPARVLTTDEWPVGPYGARPRRRAGVHQCRGQASLPTSGPAGLLETCCTELPMCVPILPHLKVPPRPSLVTLDLDAVAVAVGAGGHPHQGAPSWTTAPCWRRAFGGAHVVSMVGGRAACRPRKLLPLPAVHGAGSQQGASPWPAPACQPSAWRPRRRSSVAAAAASSALPSAPAQPRPIFHPATPFPPTGRPPARTGRVSPSRYRPSHRPSHRPSPPPPPLPPPAHRAAASPPPGQRSSAARRPLFHRSVRRARPRYRRQVRLARRVPMLFIGAVFLALHGCSACSAARERVGRVCHACATPSVASSTRFSPTAELVASVEFAAQHSLPCACLGALAAFWLWWPYSDAHLSMRERLVAVALCVVLFQSVGVCNFTLTGNPLFLTTPAVAHILPFVAGCVVAEVARRHGGKVVALGSKSCARGEQCERYVCSIHLSG